MPDARQEGSWDPRLIELMQFAINRPELAREFALTHPEVLVLRTGLGETALHYLAIENYAAAVQLLIDLGADVHVTNKFGASALADALQAKAHEAAAVLRRAGANT